MLYWHILNFLLQCFLMKFNKKILVLVLLILLLVFIIVFVLAFFRSKSNLSEPQPEIKEEESMVVNAPTLAPASQDAKDLGREAVEASATYAYDGSGLQFESSLPLPCADCWELVFSFESSAGGYGDRTGSILTQAVAPHEIKVYVEYGEVVAMVTDGKYDEIKQEFLGQSE